jgi:hypothetical protein
MNEKNDPTHARFFHLSTFLGEFHSFGMVIKVLKLIYYYQSDKGKPIEK